MAAPDPAQSTPAEPQEDDPSLKASLRDGVSHAVMMGAGETYLGPFGIFLKASTLQVGLLASLPPLFGALTQWLAAQAMDRFPSRRKAVVAGALLQALTWLPIALLPFLLGSGDLPVALLIGLVLVYHGANGATVPAWNSLIGDLVPAGIRGRFFGNRNRLTGLSSFVALLLAGLCLDVFERAGRGAAGYLVIFGAALAARLNSARWLSRYADPPFRLMPEEVFTFRQFLRRSPHSNFARFVFFVAAINFAVAFSGPYFALYMLRDLQFSYAKFTAVTAVVAITQFLTFRYWGGLSDRFGNKKILNLCSWGVALVPALWIFSDHIAYLVAIQAYGGFVWAGFSLAAGNFLFDAVSPPKRARCVAYQGLINSVGVLAGSLLGGFAAGHLPASYTVGGWTWRPVSVLLVLFLISGLIRLVAIALFLRRFREVRPVEPIGHRELIFRISHIRPIAGATFNILTGRSRNLRNGH